MDSIEHQVREVVIKAVAQSVLLRGRPEPQIDDDTDLVRDALVDSLGILELLTDLEATFGVTIAFDGQEADTLTRCGSLIAHVSAIVRQTRE